MKHFKLDKDGIDEITTEELKACQVRACARLQPGMTFGPTRQPSFCCHCGCDVVFDPSLTDVTHMRHVCLECIIERMEAGKPV